MSYINVLCQKKKKLTKKIGTKYQKKKKLFLKLQWTGLVKFSLICPWKETLFSFYCLCSHPCYEAVIMLFCFSKILNSISPTWDLVSSLLSLSSLMFLLLFLLLWLIWHVISPLIFRKKLYIMPVNLLFFRVTHQKDTWIYFYIWKWKPILCMLLKTIIDAQLKKVQECL